MASKSRVAPEEYLASDRYTRYLRESGVTQELLDGVVFGPRNFSEFSDWPIRCAKGWPAALERDKRVWCAFRWLVLDHPAHSRDTREAWSFITLRLQELTDPAYTAGLKQIRHGEKRGATAHEEALKRAQSFVDHYTGVRRSNPKLSKTAAVERARTDLKIPKSTAWKYLSEHDSRK